MTRGSGGTPAYMSPEQADGEPLTRRTDLWSWALCILEMFNGGRTWRNGPDALDALRAYRDEPGALVGPGRMPDAVGDVLVRCFAEDPEKRPRTLLDAATALGSVYAEVAGRPYARTEPRGGVETADSLNNRAASLLDLGREKEAEELLGRALHLSPQHLESTANRVRLDWGRAGLRDDEIRTRMEEASKGHPASARAAHLQGARASRPRRLRGSGGGPPGGRGGGDARRRPPGRHSTRGVRAGARLEGRRRLDGGA